MPCICIKHQQTQHSPRPRPTVFLSFLILLFVGLTAPLAAQLKPAWTTPITPFRIADNLYYVGSQDLAAYLITTPDGNILINANLPSSPPQIRTAVEQLGFHWSDTRILLTSQAHFDHAGGSAQVQRETHARLMVMDADVPVVESGGRTDFLRASGSVADYPPASVDRILHDGDTVTVGGTTLTAHRTGGHTRGCTTWTLRAHLPGEPEGTLRTVVIVGGYTVWSDYQLIDTPTHPASYPAIADDLHHTFALYESLPAEIFLADHGDHFNLLEKLTRMPREGATVWLDPQGYRTTIATGKAAFEKQLAQQQSAIH